LPFEKEVDQKAYLALYIQFLLVSPLRILHVTIQSSSFDLRPSLRIACIRIWLPSSTRPCFLFSPPIRVLLFRMRSPVRYSKNDIYRRPSSSSSSRLLNSGRVISLDYSGAAYFLKEPRSLLACHFLGWVLALGSSTVTPLTGTSAW
jgi:hypothetical protein